MHTHADGSSHDHVTEATAPTQPSQAVVLDVGEFAGALILRSSAQRNGIEVEIHPIETPDQRRHVWVLPREGRDGETVYAAIFPSLVPGTYAVLEQDGSIANTIDIPANGVTYGSWGEILPD
jgi:hypothetical protein